MWGIEPANAWRRIRATFILGFPCIAYFLGAMFFVAFAWQPGAPFAVIEIYGRAPLLLAFSIAPVWHLIHFAPLFRARDLIENWKELRLTALRPHELIWGCWSLWIVSAVLAVVPIIGLFLTTIINALLHWNATGPDEFTSHWLIASFVVGAIVYFPCALAALSFLRVHFIVAWVMALILSSLTLPSHLAYDYSYGSTIEMVLTSRQILMIGLDLTMHLARIGIIRWLWTKAIARLEGPPESSGSRT